MHPRYRNDGTLDEMKRLIHQLVYDTDDFFEDWGYRRTRESDHDRDGSWSSGSSKRGSSSSGRPAAGWTPGCRFPRAITTCT